MRFGSTDSTPKADLWLGGAKEGDLVLARRIRRVLGWLRRFWAIWTGLLSLIGGWILWLMRGEFLRNLCSSQCD